ncbi:MAG: glycosyltransferase family 2 protein [Bacteroidia bacterium]|nr:glycosyltransferase family 2 protein [Bacteroidia bacterium]
MLFSVIIPTYNRAGLIKNTLQSLVSQTFGDYEVIVVDDGSTDNTKEVVAQMNSSKIKYFHKANEERAVARNFGADKAIGDYLIFLDSDDTMEPNHLLNIKNHLLAANNEVEFLFTGYKIITAGGETVYTFGQSGLFNPNKLAYGNYLGCSGVVIKNDLFKKFYFNTDPKLILFEDWELWLRISSKHPLYCIPSKSIVMINHNERSVLNFETTYLIERVSCLKKLVLKQSSIISASFLRKQIFLMGIYSYTSLHLALTKKSRLTTLKYLFLSFINLPTLIFRKRFYGILKNLF